MPGLLDPAQNLLDLLLAEPAQPLERLRTQVKDVADVVYPTGVQQTGRGLVAEPVDVQGTTGGKMEDRLP